MTSILHLGLSENRVPLNSVQLVRIIILPAKMQICNNMYIIYIYIYKCGVVQSSKTHQKQTLHLYIYIYIIYIIYICRLFDSKNRLISPEAAEARRLLCLLIIFKFLQLTEMLRWIRHLPVG